jgi:hypothetical protein
MEMESSTNTRLPLHSIGIIYPSSSLCTSLHYGIIFTLITSINGEQVIGLSNVSFLAIHAKGGRVLAQSKRAAPPPISKFF